MFEFDFESLALFPSYSSLRLLTPLSPSPLHCLSLSLPLPIPLHTSLPLPPPYSCLSPSLPRSLFLTHSFFLPHALSLPHSPSPCPPLPLFNILSLSIPHSPSLSLSLTSPQKRPHPWPETLPLACHVSKHPGPPRARFPEDLLRLGFRRLEVLLKDRFLVPYLRGRSLAARGPRIPYLIAACVCIPHLRK